MRAFLAPTPCDLEHPSYQQLLRVGAVTILGFGIYGFTVGFWRSPLMGAFVAIKMPLLILSTLACNGLFNGLIALVLGSGLGFRQSLLSLLSAFSITALILASLAPVSLFLSLNTPPPDSPAAVTAHAGYLLAHTALIAMSGCIGVIRLRGLLRSWCPTPLIARATWIAWIAGNGFIGAQLSWIYRPFFGTPSMEVAFLRDDPMQGSFYEAIGNSAQQILRDHPSERIFAICLILVGFTTTILAAIQYQRQQRNIP